jgi:peptide/nickel transport system substrate-binding protein
LVDYLPLNKISRRTALALPLGLAASSSTIFNGFAKADEPVRGGTMVMIVQPEPSTLAHYAVTAGNIPPIATQIYEGLVTYDWDQNPQPNLATSWETALDGKSITFKLREGVLFHNGKPFTSADVQFSFMEILKKYHPFAPLLLAELTDVDTPDAMTAILRLANPAPYLMKALAGRDLPIMCKSVFEGTPILQNPTANKPIGTGPFKFGQWERGQFGSTATTNTGSRGCPISTISSRVSSPMPRRALPRSRPARRISPAIAPSITPISRG